MSRHLFAFAVLLCTLIVGAQARPNSNFVRLIRRHGDDALVVDTTEDDHDHDHESDEVCHLHLDQSEYDLGLHIGAVFILLVTSSIGVFGALYAGRSSRLCVSEHVLNCLKHFGTGIILATGFIHMLPAAIDSLSHPCLGSFNEHFSSWGLLFAMLAILAMQLIEFLAIGQAHHRHQHNHHDHDHSHEEDTTPQATTTDIHTKPDRTSLDIPFHSTDQVLSDDHHHHQHTHEHSDGLGHACHDVATLLDRGSHLRISTYILELGITLHSIFIGITLGLANGSSYITLLIAIVFHQFFEGIALGSRIAEITQGETSTKAYILSLIFSIITPLGTAIGIGVHSSYTPYSPANLLVQGIFEAISAGVLIYMALVNLLAEEFTNCRKFHQRERSIKIIYYLAMYLGVAIMSLIGRWA